MRSLLRWVATALLVGVGSVLLATPAAAHPTDEVVQQLYQTPAASGLTVQLDLTPGVLVGPQFAATVDTDGDGAASAAEVTAHVAAVRSAVTATVDGAAVDLVVTGTQYPPAELLAAAGGTVTLTMTAPVAADTHRLTVADTYEPGIKSAVQMSVLVPPDPIPLGRIGHADDGRSMTVALNPGTTTAPEAVAGAPATAGSSMLDALRRPLTSPWALLVLIGACCLLGALHALTPGHGKALLAAYLVGDRGTARHAVTLGLMITFTHTAAVLALGAVVLTAGSAVSGLVVPVLTVVAGAVVLVLGIRLVRRRWTVTRSGARPRARARGRRPRARTRPRARARRAADEAPRAARPRRHGPLGRDHPLPRDAERAAARDRRQPHRTRPGHDRRLQRGARRRARRARSPARHGGTGPEPDH